LHQDPLEHSFSLDRAKSFSNALICLPRFPKTYKLIQANRFQIQTWKPSLLSMLHKWYQLLICLVDGLRLWQVLSPIKDMPHNILHMLKLSFSIPQLLFDEQLILAFILLPQSS